MYIKNKVKVAKVMHTLENKTFFRHLYLKCFGEKYFHVPNKITYWNYCMELFNKININCTIVTFKQHLN